jgi:hypothetical protein
MPIQESFRNNLKLKFEDNPDIDGLARFIKRIERDYYSSVSVRTCVYNTDKNSLVISLECNFDLVEILYYQQKGFWGCPPNGEKCMTSSPPFAMALAELKRLNTDDLDVEELSLFMRDSSIIIKKIYQNSIGEQLETIFEQLAAHYVHLTKKLTETPYEIYVPVFEDDFTKEQQTLANIKTGNNSKRNYFGYWGLYFDSEEDAVIYDLGNKSIISGDLYMLNH